MLVGGSNDGPYFNKHHQMTQNLDHGPFTIHELVDAIRGHWQIAGVDVGDVERSISENPEESPTILKRTKQHLDRIVYACLNHSLRGVCSPRIHQALDEFQMAATSLADVWSSIGDIGLNGKRTARKIGIEVDRVVPAFDELLRLVELTPPAIGKESKTLKKQPSTRAGRPRHTSESEYLDRFSEKERYIIDQWKRRKPPKPERGQRAKLHREIGSELSPEMQQFDVANVIRKWERQIERIRESRTK